MDRGTLDKALAELVSQLEREADAGFSAVLYGSAARGDWIPGRSDVNLMLVVPDPAPESLRKLTPAITRWHEAGFTPPLIIGREEWSRAADVFPIEITDMRLAYRVLSGSDPVTAVEADSGDLRRAIESELRGKLVRLRQAYVRFGDVAATLGGFALSSIPALLVLLRCTNVLRGQPAGESPEETVAALSGALGADAEVIVEIAAHRRDQEWQCPPATFARYLEAVRRAVDLVDHLQRGDR
ncbi:MAG: nucleotidyltransferase domain-containing protein [Gemmatimonadota bacterium]